MENKFISQKTVISQQKTGYSTKQISNLSILPDLATGWRPKLFIIPPPILVKYKQSLISSLISNYERQSLKILYLGTRHYNSFSFHNRMKHDYHVRFGIKPQDLPEKFEDDIQKYKKLQNRPFTGMNTSIHTNITFDSNFQSGNLDMVIQKLNHQYDLFLRPDTNTCGHTQWFYFRVNVKKTVPEGQKQVIKFNICNNRKFKTLFCRGMKPYVLSKKLTQQQGLGWHQRGFNVTYKKYQPKVFEQQKVTKDITPNSNKQGSGTNQESQNKQNSQQTARQVKQVLQSSQKKQLNAQPVLKKPIFSPPIYYYCLSFQYQLTHQQDIIQFAYCPPYTYSDLKKDLSKLKKLAIQQQNCEVLQEKLCVSLSGLEIPLLTITDSTVENQQKSVVFATARIHPGEANASHVMNGFLNYITSPQAQQLRKKCVFKIVPMINPDGVILGNFRTGLAGKDLNRQFKVKNTSLLPQINALKQYIRKLKMQKGSSLVYFLDFHGHSTKKSVFVYGPEYELWDLKYQRSKILPKMISYKSPMFKINSCQYKVPTYKKSTARAFMLDHIPFCYTVESSIGIYQQKNGQNVNFSIQKWQQMGYLIGSVIQSSMDRIQQQSLCSISKSKKSKKSLILKQSSSETIGLKNTLSIPKIPSIPSIGPILCQTVLPKQYSSQHLLQSLQNSLPSKKYLQPIKHFRNKQKEIDTIIKEQKQDKQTDSQDDGKSDCQSDNNDLDKIEYQLLSKDIMKIIQDFKTVIGIDTKKNNKNFSITKKKTLLSKDVSHRQKSKNFTTKQNVNVRFNIQQMKLVPSLKHKLNKLKHKNLSKQKNLNNRSLQRVTLGLMINQQNSMVLGRAI